MMTAWEVLSIFRNGLVSCAIMALSSDHELRRIGFTCCLH